MIAFIRMFPMALLLIGGCVGALITLLARPERSSREDMGDIRARLNALERKP
jgi:gas vesicle protein